mgnify:CR=1 FL=1
MEADRDTVRRELGGIQGLKNLKFLREENGAVYFELHSEPGKHLWERVGEIAKENGWKLTVLREKPFTLEQIFLALTKPEESELKGGAA